MSNWKAAGPDHVQGFWFESHRSTSQTLITSTGVCECWRITYMDDRRTHKFHHERQRDSCRKLQTNCLPSMMWTLLTSIFSEAIYGHLSSQELLPNERRWCRKNSRGIKDQLLIDQVILKNCWRRLTDLSMTWEDYRKAYDMVPHSWILECASGWSGPEYNHLNREQYGKVEDIVDIKPGGTWDSKQDVNLRGITTDSCFNFVIWKSVPRPEITTNNIYGEE